MTHALPFSFFSFILLSYSSLLVHELRFGFSILESRALRSVLKSPFKPWLFPGTAKTREKWPEFIHYISTSKAYNTLRLYLLPCVYVNCFHINPLQKLLSVSTRKFSLFKISIPLSTDNSGIYPDYILLLMTISVFYSAIFFDMWIALHFQLTQDTTRTR